jgi:transposase
MNNFFKTPDLNTQIRSVNILNFENTTGMSFKAIERQMGYHYTVVSRLVRKHTQTNNVKDLPRSGRPRVTSDREDRALQRLVRRMPFANQSRTQIRLAAQ